MAIMYITELSKMGGIVEPGLLVQVPHAEDIVTTQAVSFTGTAGDSAAFNAATKFIRVVVDTNANIKMSATAVADTDPKLPAHVVEYYGVAAAGVISAVQSTA